MIQWIIVVFLCPKKFKEFPRVTRENAAIIIPDLVRKSKRADHGWVFVSLHGFDERQKITELANSIKRIRGVGRVKAYSGKLYVDVE